MFGAVAVGVVGGEAEERGERVHFGRDVDELAFDRGVGREGELLAVRAAAVVGGAEPVDREVGDVGASAHFDGLRYPARERTVDHAGDDEIGGDRASGDQREHYE